MTKQDKVKKIQLDPGEKLLAFDPIKSPHGCAFPWRIMTDTQYGATNRGRVINLTKQTELVPFEAANGYLKINVKRDGVRKNIFIHRLVAYLFCENGKFKHYVHHIDGNIRNNNADNLLWVTSEEHGQADKLRREAAKTDSWETYNDFIKETSAGNK